LTGIKFCPASGSSLTPAQRSDFGSTSKLETL
jgi:hypothetical protein